MVKNRQKGQTINKHQYETESKNAKTREQSRVKIQNNNNRSHVVASPNKSTLSIQMHSLKPLVMVDWDTFDNISL